MLEQEIINKIGKNKTTEKHFNDGVKISSGELLGFYTYKGEVCILDCFGMDVNFSSYDAKDQKIIHEAIMNNKWK
jgi:hypothetical protein